MDTKSSRLAIVLSCFWPGLGQLYAGRSRRGGAMIVTAPVISALGWGTFAALCALFPGCTSTGGLVLMGMVAAAWPGSFWIWGMIDARRVCDSFNRRVRRGGLATPVQEYPAVRD
jgi:hypothetical protein